MTHAPFRIDELRHARQGARCGCTIHYCESIDSTNTAAYQLAVEGAPEGSVVIAEAQTKGRGRLGRSWTSPPFRNLYLSIVLRPAMAAADAPQLGLVTGLATAEAARDWCARAVIKWPNDVLVDGRKLAGILTEMDAADGRVRFVIVGIGVNLNTAVHEFPDELRDKAIGLATAAGAPIDRVAFAIRLLSHLEQRYDRFLRDGFDAIAPAWESLSCVTGRHVQIDSGDQRYGGIVIGIAHDGSLRLRDEHGAETRVIAGDVTVVDGYERACAPNIPPEGCR
jgi:BirA family transcriptional regulator, biotin operon repressor / biotin---[acetyl-CoA-carboxylase] ligase